MINFNKSSFDVQKSLKNIIKKTLTSGNKPVPFSVYFDNDYKNRSNSYITISPLSFDFSNTKTDSSIRELAFVIKFYYRKSNVFMGSSSSKKETLKTINNIVEKIKQVFVENKTHSFVNVVVFGTESSTFGSVTRVFSEEDSTNTELFNIQITDVNYNPSRSDLEDVKDLNIVSMITNITIEDIAIS